MRDKCGSCHGKLFKVESRDENYKKVVKRFCTTSGCPMFHAELVTTAEKEDGDA